MKMQHERSKARQQALQILYQSDIRSCPVSSILADGNYISDTGVIDDFARELVCGVSDNKDSIDAEIVSISENWKLSRMPVVDRNILRIAMYELSFTTDVPDSVAINEAVEMAKLFGGEESFKFVNGVLGRAARIDQDDSDESPASQKSDERLSGVDDTDGSTDEEGCVRD